MNQMIKRIGFLAHLNEHLRYMETSRRLNYGDKTTA